jgi:hypothetical protein
MATASLRRAMKASALLSTKSMNSAGAGMGTDGVWHVTAEISNRMDKTDSWDGPTVSGDGGWQLAADWADRVPAWASVGRCRTSGTMTRPSLPTTAWTTASRTGGNGTKRKPTVAALRPHPLMRRPQKRAPSACADAGRGVVDDHDGEPVSPASRAPTRADRQDPQTAQGWPARQPAR